MPQAGKNDQRYSTSRREHRVPSGAGSSRSESEIPSQTSKSDWLTPLFSAAMLTGGLAGDRQWSSGWMGQNTWLCSEGNPVGSIGASTCKADRCLCSQR